MCVVASCSNEQCEWGDALHLLQQGANCRVPAAASHDCCAGSAQPEGVHSLVPIVDIQLVLQRLFPFKSDADVSAAIQAVSSDRQITISTLMPLHR